MNDSEETFSDEDSENYDNGGDEVLREDHEESLDMHLLCMIRKFDMSTKRMILSMFSEALGAKNHGDPFDIDTRGTVIDLSSEPRFRVENLLETADMIFTRTLSKKQRDLYNYLARIRLFSKNTMTGNEYIELLNMCNSLARLMGVPFSIEEQYDGLKTWDEWNDVIEKAIKEGRGKFGRKRKK